MISHFDYCTILKKRNVFSILIRSIFYEIIILYNTRPSKQNNILLLIR